MLYETREIRYSIIYYVRFLIHHPHPIDSGESGQVGNEAALSFLFMWVGMLDKKSFYKGV